MKILYSGSFNPFTIGHQYIFDLTCKMFGKENVYIGVGCNKEKNINKEQVRYSLAPITNNVIVYEGLTAAIVKQHKFDLLVRGIRAGKSIEQEEELAHWNKKLSGVETILIPTPIEYNQISSSAIRELIKYKADVSEYVNPDVLSRWSAGKPMYYVYFGQSCMGKSTYLKHCSPLDLDTKIWDHVKLEKEDLERLKRDCKTNFLKFSPEFISDCVDVIGKNTNWEEMLYRALIYHRGYIDAPAIGLYWKYIPELIRGRISLIKISTNEENRKRNMLARGLTEEFLKNADYFYQNPPFFDKEIVLE